MRSPEAWIGQKFADDIEKRFLQNPEIEASRTFTLNKNQIIETCGYIKDSFFLTVGASVGSGSLIVGAAALGF